MAAITKTKSLSIGTPIHIFEGTLDMTALPYNTSSMAEQDITITGVKSTDILISFKLTDESLFGIGNARVKADNTIAVVPIATETDAEIDPADTLNYRLIFVRPV